MLAGQVEALDRTFAEFGDLPVNPWVVGKAGEEAGGAAGRVGAAGFVEAEELAQGTGPQVGRGRGEEPGPGEVVHLVTLLNENRSQFKPFQVTCKREKFSIKVGK